jgi:hypothetical protein
MHKLNLKYFSFLLLIGLSILSDEAPERLIQVIAKPKIQVTSFLVENNKSYPASNLMDNTIRTSWCEGSKGSGIGESIEISFPPTAALGVSFFNGYGETRDLHAKNNRVEKYEMIVTTKDGKTFSKKGKFTDKECEKVDERECSNFMDDPNQYQQCIDKLNLLCHASESSLGDDILFGSPKCVTKIQFKILGIYKGKKYDDTCISEIQMIVSNTKDFQNLFPDFVKLQKSCQ